MPRKPTRPLLPSLTLIALVLLAPTLATGLPQGDTLRSTTEYSAVTLRPPHQVAREPMAALLLFQEAARRETTTAEFAREVAASLTRTRGAYLE